MHNPSRRPRWLLRGLSLLVLLALVGASLTPSAAQKGPPLAPDEKAAELKSPDLALVAGAGCGYLLITPAELLEHPLTKQMPANVRESFAELEREMPARMGAALRTLRRFTLAFPVGTMTEPVGLLTSNKGFAVAVLEKNLGPGWEKREIEHSVLFHHKQRSHVLLHESDSLLLIGREKDVQAFLQRAKNGRPDATLSRGLEAAEGGAQLVVGGRPEDLVRLMMLRHHAEPRLEKKTAPNEAPVSPKGAFPKDDIKSIPPSGPPGSGGPPSGPPGRPEDFQVAQRHEPGGEPTLADLLRELPPEVLPFKPLLTSKAGFAAVRLNDDSANVTINLGYARAEQLDDAQASLRITFFVLREILPRWWLDEIGLKKESAVEVVRALDKIGDALGKVTIRAAGTTLQATATLPGDPATVGVLLRELQFNGFATERMNNLKQIGIALHNHCAAFNTFPGSAYYSAQGKPLLSWRVAILPYIEEDNLYRQFKLDEPWDGPNNIKLLEKMPRIFAPPYGAKAESGHTFFQGFSGPGTVFDPQADRKMANVCQGIRITSITDGTSNTVMVGESGKAVPWTKPEDISCAGPGVPALGCIPGSDRCLVLFGDGSVRMITTKPRADLFQAIVSRAGGEVLGFDDLEPGRQNREPRDFRPDPESRKEPRR